MGKPRASANVVDLEAFRQRKSMRDADRVQVPMQGPVMMPVWVCWVPIWAPMLG